MRHDELLAKRGLPPARSPSQEQAYSPGDMPMDDSNVSLSGDSRLLNISQDSIESG